MISLRVFRAEASRLLMLLMLLVWWRPAAAQPVSLAASAYDHNLLVRADGSLWAWGNNSSGQLGDGSTTDRPVPTAILPGTRWRQVAATGQFSAGLKADNSLWTWGDNTYGSLGDGSTTSHAVPTALLPGSNWQQVAAGVAHALALRADGTLWAWGYNGKGQLGDGTTTSQLAPVPVAAGSAWQQVAAGFLHTLAIRSDGTLWAWGDNTYGELGDGTGISRAVPVQVGSAATWQQVVAGSYFSLGIRTDGTLWAWGNDYYGQLGDGTTRAGQATPQQVGTAANWQRVACTGSRVLAVRTDGSLWSWGAGYLSAFSDYTTYLTPAPVAGPAGPWLAVGAGGSHSVAVQVDGSVWAWGSNGHGQVGSLALATNPLCTPAQVGTATTWRQAITATSIPAILGTTLAVRTDGTRWAAGTNVWQHYPNFPGSTTGDGSTAPRLELAQVGPDASWQRMASCGNSAAGIRTDGSLWMWGDNREGQLGDGTTTDRALPVPVAPGTSWRQVALSLRGHTLAIRSDGTLWAWGINQYGQLGDGTTTSRLLPTQVGTATTWVSVAASEYTSQGVQANGSRWAWGSNGGTYGDGTTAGNYAPGQVGTDLNWRELVLSTSYTLALRTDGSLWAWGNNGSGQLGDGTATYQALPVAVAPGSTWQTVAVGANHSLGVRSDGTLWAWGSVDYGRTGTGANCTANVAQPNLLVPTQVGTATNWLSVSGSDTESLGVRTDGTLWVWGRHATLRSYSLDLLPVLGPAPLPVTLVAFAAEASCPAAVRLTWTTASELNSARFEVERSADGQAFVAVGTVAAAGSSATTRHYAYLDAAAPAGQLYYRLRQVDQDGTAAYSPVRAVALGSAGLVAYPNPGVGPVAVRGAAAGASVQVLDALGRVVATALADATGAAQLPAGLPPGLYVLRAGSQTTRLLVL